MKYQSKELTEDTILSMLKETLLPLEGFVELKDPNLKEAMKK